MRYEKKAIKAIRSLERFQKVKNIIAFNGICFLEELADLDDENFNALINMPKIINLKHMPLGVVRFWVEQSMEIENLNWWKSAIEHIECEISLFKVDEYKKQWQSFINPQHIKTPTNVDKKQRSKIIQAQLF